MNLSSTQTYSEGLGAAESRIAYMTGDGAKKEAEVTLRPGGGRKITLRHSPSRSLSPSPADKIVYDIDHYRRVVEQLLGLSPRTSSTTNNSVTIQTFNAIGEQLTSLQSLVRNNRETINSIGGRVKQIADSITNNETPALADILYLVESVVSHDPTFTLSLSVLDYVRGEFSGDGNQFKENLKSHLKEEPDGDVAKLVKEKIIAKFIEAKGGPITVDGISREIDASKANRLNPEELIKVIDHIKKGKKASDKTTYDGFWEQDIFSLKNTGATKPIEVAAKMVIDPEYSTIQIPGGAGFELPDGLSTTNLNSTEIESFLNSLKEPSENFITTNKLSSEKEKLEKAFNNKKDNIADEEKKTELVQIFGKYRAIEAIEYLMGVYDRSQDENGFDGLSINDGDKFSDNDNSSELRGFYRELEKEKERLKERNPTYSEGFEIVRQVTAPLFAYTYAGFKDGMDFSKNLRDAMYTASVVTAKKAILGGMLATATNGGDVTSITTGTKARGTQSKEGILNTVSKVSIIAAQLDEVHKKTYIEPLKKVRDVALGIVEKTTERINFEA